MGRFLSLKRFGASAIGLVVLALVLLLQFTDPTILVNLRMQVFDSHQNAVPREREGSSRVAIVDIDEDAIAELGQWPWPRTDLAELTRRLGEAGAEVVVYDFVFSESDRTSPAAIAARYAEAGTADVLGEGFASLPSHDTEFARSFAEVPVVLGYFLDPVERGRAVEPKLGFTLHGSLPDVHVESYAGAILPLPELEEQAAGLGFVSRQSDSDEIVRRAPLVAIEQGNLVPSLSLEAVRLAMRAESLNLLASDGSGETRGAPGAAVAVRIDGTEIPVTDAGEMWVHFPRPEQQDMIPAGPIVTGSMSEAALADSVAGRIVFVGGSAAGLQDLVSTPVEEVAPGVTVHAAAAEQMLAGDFLERPDWAPGVEFVLALVMGAVLAMLLPQLGVARGLLLALGAIALVLVASRLAFSQADYLLDPIYPVLALALVYIFQGAIVFYREQRQRQYIRSAFDRFLSPEMVRQIADDPGKLELGGAERDMSVLMCDIRGFSSISERYQPKEVINFLIEFLTPMSDILMARKATLDKYIGDAILAFWNAPLDDPDHHENAARSALAMIAATAELNRTMPGRKGVTWPDEEVKIGIGLNSGVCCVGNMGSRQRLAYSLIGDTVNVAARLEGLTKQYGVPIIVGSALAGELGGFALLELDSLRVVGRSRPETIHALLGDEEMAASAPFQRLRDAHGKVLQAYRAQQWDAARQALDRGEDAYASAGITGLHELFRKRIARLRADPPGPGWDGVYQATEK